MKLETYMLNCQNRVNREMEKWLPKTSIEPKNLHQAMRYASLNGGKRLRSIFIYTVGKSLGANLRVLDKIAAAIEFIHAGSLIHDDLPAIDNDDLRRGKPSCHKAFGEAAAILAGDALQTLAFEALATLDEKNLDSQTRLKIINVIAHAIGSVGMAGGEAMDVAETNKKISLKKLQLIYQLKTSQLLAASVVSAALAANCHRKNILTDLQQFANHIGLAFQIHDDIIGIESDTKTLGKPQGSDVDKNKPTFPALIGMDNAKKKRTQIFHKAVFYLRHSGIDSKYLIDISRYAINRNF